MFSNLHNLVKNVLFLAKKESAYDMYREDFMTLPYERNFKNCTLRNAIGALHYKNIHSINKKEFVYIMKPSTMLEKGRKRKFSNIKRGAAIFNILEECRKREPVFIVSFRYPQEARNLSSEYRKRYPKHNFEWNLFINLLKEF